MLNLRDWVSRPGGGRQTLAYQLSVKSQRVGRSTDNTQCAHCVHVSRLDRPDASASSGCLGFNSLLSLSLQQELNTLSSRFWFSPCT